MIESMQTDFPEPVVPPIRTCDILAISAITTFPAMSLPTANTRLEECSQNLFVSIISHNLTIGFSLYKISIPTDDFPKIGASI